MPTDNAKFLYNKDWFSIHIHDETVQLTCIKKSNASSMRDKSINLLNVIASSYETDVWYVEKEKKTWLEMFYSYVYPSIENCFSLSINYWEKDKTHQRKLKTIKLQTEEKNACEKWANLITTGLAETLEKYNYVRPCNLLVFVNPHCGFKRSKSIYQETVLPLFKLAGITETTVYTEYAEQAKKYIETKDISAYDGVITVGGDGTFTEVANGVLIKEQLKKGIPLDGGDVVDKRPLTYAKPEVRLGMIPAGSGNCIVWTSQGTSDPETATLQIICGESHPLDIASLHGDSGKFIQFCMGSHSFGFLADVLCRAESLRVFGRFRYEASILLEALKNTVYPYEVSYIESSPDDPVDFSEETSRCLYPCRTCIEEPDEAQQSLLFENNEVARSAKMSTELQRKPTANPSTSNRRTLTCSKEKGLQSEVLVDPFAKSSSAEITPSWQMVRGRFSAINCYFFSFKYEKCLKGFSPSAHLSDGTIDLLLLPWSKDRLYSLRFLSVSLDKTSNPYQYPLVRFHRVKGFRVRPLSEEELIESNAEDKSTSVENVSQPKQEKTRPLYDQRVEAREGECGFMDSSVFIFWAHKGLITIFSKGIERN